MDEFMVKDPLDPIKEKALLKNRPALSGYKNRRDKKSNMELGFGQLPYAKWRGQERTFIGKCRICKRKVYSKNPTNKMKRSPVHKNCLKKKIF